MQITFNETESKRVDIYLSEALAVSRSFIKNQCSEDKILVNGKLAKPSLLLREGEIITYDLSVEPLDLAPTKIDLDIVYEDNSLLVINKPAGLTVHPGAGNKTNTLVNALLYYNKNLSSIGGMERPGIIHRLDKDTSGLIVVAKNNNTHNKLADDFKNRLVTKKYVALVYGYLKEQQGSIELPIARHLNNYQKFVVDATRGKYARTDYTVLKEANEKSLLDIALYTGRTHQIRVHLSHLGYPIVGDGLYSKKSGDHQLLHAYCLSFTHPETHKVVEFTAPFPKWANI